jgi:GntR family phosphonate transport system transcriptional regulator
MTGTRKRNSDAAAVLRGSGIAVWKQLEGTLAAEIRDRVFADSGRLPSENLLAERFGVNRHTVRQAIAALQSAGLVRVEQGKGAFVQQHIVDYTLGRRTRYTENIRRNKLLPGKQLLGARELPASEKVARALGLRKGKPVLMVELLDEADGQPIGLAVLYYPAARFPGLLDMLEGNTRMSEILRHFGVTDYLRASNRITTQMPTDELARLLQQPKTRPLLCVESVDVDLDGVPIKYGETVFSGDRVQLVFDPRDG